jgi:hypothetical protein
MGTLAEAPAFPCTVPSLTALAAHVWTAIGGSKFAIALSDLGALERALRALVPALNPDVTAGLPVRPEL